MEPEPAKYFIVSRSHNLQCRLYDSEAERGFFCYHFFTILFSYPLFKIDLLLHNIMLPFFWLPIQMSQKNHIFKICVTNFLF